MSALERAVFSKQIPGEGVEKKKQVIAFTTSKEQNLS